MFSSINKTFGCCSKIFGWSNKNPFVVPNFVAVTKPFFSVWEPKEIQQQSTQWIQKIFALPIDLYIMFLFCFFVVSFHVFKLQRFETHERESNTFATDSTRAKLLCALSDFSSFFMARLFGLKFNCKTVWWKCPVSWYIFYYSLHNFEKSRRHELAPWIKGDTDSCNSKTQPKQNLPNTIWINLGERHMY